MLQNTIRAVVSLIAMAISAPTIAAQVPAPAWPAAQPAAVQRWQAMRFGMFIHWGPVSITGQEIGWSRGAQTPIEKYDNLYKEFNPTKFNADEWVSVAKAAGMKYIILTTKHHDGFCLWDTKLTDYNIMNSPFKRDVVKELAEACKKQGIAFGTYYSVCDWHHPDFPLTSPGGRVKREKSDLDAYNRYLLGQIRELITNYGPLLTIWNDVPQMFQDRGAVTIKMARELQPDILMNNRTGDGGDYDTPEQRVGGFQMNRPWESCMTISAHNHWAWGGANDGVKSLAACLQMLIRCAGGDGNMMLNVGPMPTGEIEAIQVDRLKEMGAWMTRNGESIYGTRGGPFKPLKHLVSTRKDDTIYLHVLAWPEETLKLPALPAKIVKSRVLTGGQATVNQTDAGIEITVPKADRQEIDTVIALQLDKPAMDIAPVAIASTGKSLTEGKQATASNVFQNNNQYAASKAVDGDEETRWATDAGTRACWLEVDLGKPATFDRVAIKEYEPRIRSFELQSKDDADWKTFYKGSTAGLDFEARFPAVTARHVRLNVLDASNGPTIWEFQLFAPALQPGATR
ncbi:MAG: alpha-L-fucosidase [Tepidisphaeraceae bacterium]|jgi:alpha-L-fucosidase